MSDPEDDFLSGEYEGVLGKELRGWTVCRWNEKKRNSLHLGELLRIHPLINFWIKLTSAASIMADCSLIIKCKPVRWQHVPVKSSELPYNLKNCFAEDRVNLSVGNFVFWHFKSCHKQTSLHVVVWRSIVHHAREPTVRLPATRRLILLLL